MDRREAGRVTMLTLKCIVKKLIVWALPEYAPNLPTCGQGCMLPTVPAGPKVSQVSMTAGRQAAEAVETIKDRDLLMHRTTKAIAFPSTRRLRSRSRV